MCVAGHQGAKIHMLALYGQVSLAQWVEPRKLHHQTLAVRDSHTFKEQKQAQAEVPAEVSAV